MFRDVEEVQNLGKKRLEKKEKLVKRIIREKAYRSGVDELMRKYGMDALASTIQILSESGVFTSRSAARRRFPGLGRGAPLTDFVDDEPLQECDAYCEIAEEATEEGAPAEEECWKPEVPEPEEETLADTYDNWPCEPEAAKEDYPIARDPEPEAALDPPAFETEEETTSQKPADCEPDCEPVAPAEDETPAAETKPIDIDEIPTEEAKPPDEGVYRESRIGDPTREAQTITTLPFSSQYKLMAYLQEVLEGACFSYVQRTWPGLLHKNDWNCVEAVPLATWMNEFVRLQTSFDTQPSRDLLQSIAEIQDTAVKRTPIDWPKMKKFLDNAVELVEILSIKEYGDIIGKIRMDIGKTVEGLRLDEQKAEADCGGTKRAGQAGDRGSKRHEKE
ncbi:hypothetical protein F53441_12566 [Fusarium austroafricanum]|uniref:Uncharacterized protein n=1 Tax=Fusarium austroafricanum TaxID=2364996 RepID=A0A8H4JXM8_9HYPO|nr:hypothetical protein F53441_12566 [Fusarium austroafricanum]